MVKRRRLNTNQEGVVISFIKFLLKLIGYNKTNPTKIEVTVSDESKVSQSSIDWTNPKQKISKYFTVEEALWLPKWNRLANESDGLTDDIKQNIVKFAQEMDIVRDFVGRAISVHIWYRPPAYNKLIGGAPASYHMKGRAVDFHFLGLTCDAGRDLIVPKLPEFGMRCEKKPGSNWIHLDDVAPSTENNRYFLP